jgi:hypothetical protein
MERQELSRMVNLAVEDYISGWGRQTEPQRMLEMSEILLSGKATTVRMCIGCSRVVLHGPTRCDTCAAEVTGT